MTLYCHALPGLPFLWETDDQPPGRWHGPGEGPAHDLADTPAGAWAEFLRHEGITRPEELRGIDRAIWAVEVPSDLVEPELPLEILVGGLESYDACRGEGRRLRRGGAEAMRAPSAALVPGAAHSFL